MQGDKYLMKQIKVKHPAKFCGKKHNELAVIYGEEDGVRHNIAPIESDTLEGSASVLVDYDPQVNYAELYKVLDCETFNPQPIE